jgi:hypothetical protein
MSWLGSVVSSVEHGVSDAVHGAEDGVKGVASGLENGAKAVASGVENGWRSAVNDVKAGANFVQTAIRSYDAAEAKIGSWIVSGLKDLTNGDPIGPDPIGPPPCDPGASPLPYDPSCGQPNVQLEKIGQCLVQDGQRLVQEGMQLMQQGDVQQGLGLIAEGAQLEQEGARLLMQVAEGTDPYGSVWNPGPLGGAGPLGMGAGSSGNSANVQPLSSGQAAGSLGMAAGSSSNSANAQPLSSGEQVQANQIYQYLIAKGFTPAQAEGILGNMQVESGLNTGAYNSAEGAIGLCQWEGGRRTALEQYAASQGKPVTNWQVQVDFMMKELQGSESGAYSALKSATTPAEAAAVFDQDYERSAGTSRGQRIADANSIATQVA